MACAIDLLGLAVACPVGFGLALTYGTALSYVIEPKSDALGGISGLERLWKVVFSHYFGAGCGSKVFFLDSERLRGSEAALPRARVLPFGHDLLLGA